MTIEQALEHARTHRPMYRLSLRSKFLGTIIAHGFVEGSGKKELSECKVAARAAFRQFARETAEAAGMEVKDGD